MGVETPPTLPPPDMSNVGLAINDHSPLPLVMVEGASHIVRYVNPAFCRLVDKPAHRLLGMPFSDIIEGKDEFVTMLDRVYKTGKSETHTKQHSLPHPVFWSYTMWPMIEAGQGENPLGIMIQVAQGAQSQEQIIEINQALVLGSLRQHELTETAEKLNAQLQQEITERKQAVQALRDNEWRLRYAMESARLTFVEFDFARGGVRRGAQNYTAVMGYVQPDGDSDVLAAAQALLDHVIVSDRPRVEAALQQFIDGSSVGEMDYRVLGQDGVERWIETRWSVERGPDGKPLKSFATHLDITERKQTEDAFRQSEERFRALFDRGPIAMYSCDATGATREFNQVASELWRLDSKRWNTDEDLGGSLKIYLPDGTLLPHSQTPMSQVLQGILPTAHDIEMIIERLDGSRINVIVNIVPLKNEKGEITGAINCFYDITERSRLEKQTLSQAEALADLHRRKDEFLAMLSHELRNPLAPISNAVRLLRLQKNEDPIQAQAHGIIERQVRQLTRLIDDLMEVSRISTGRIHLQEKRLALNGIVENSVETVRPLIEHHHHLLELYLPPEPIWLFADATRLEQVIVNLLTNAAKYTDDGGSISLSVQQERDEAVIRVRDSGVGIAPELLPHVFDLFSQAERSLARSQGGLGIGLSLVQRLVEMHRGTVTVTSTLGEGSEFTVRLPVMQPSVSPIMPFTEKAERNDQSIRVLVVEDNVDSAETMTMLLELFGHVVRTEHDGLAALDAAVDFKPHVVLLDIGLPGMNGFEVATRLRQLPLLADVVLVAMTGYGEQAARQRSQETGFDYHLVKPADITKLQEILANVSDARVL